MNIITFNRDGALLLIRDSLFLLPSQIDDCNFAKTESQIILFFLLPLHIAFHLERPKRRLRRGGKKAKDKGK